MMVLKKLLSVIAVILLPWVWVGNVAGAEQVPCTPVEEKSIKVEGYISKKFKKQKRDIIKEFKEAGYTRTYIRPFPMGKTAKVVAVGRCVPSYIAQHVLKKALKYTDGISSLVNQAFLHTHWIGIGTTIFDEPSQQIVSVDQVQQLLNPKLSNEEFHALYRKFSIQDETVSYFGLRPKNAKKVAD